MKDLKKNLSLVMVVLLSLVAPCLAISQADANKAVEALMQHQSQSSPVPLRALENLANKAYDNPEDSLRLEQAMIAFLKSDATAYGKQCVCKELVKIGSAACVPVLADLLLEPSVAESACYALCSNTSEQASEALRAALSKAKQPVLSQIILAIGHRKDLVAVDDLIKLLNSDDEAVVLVSMNALGYMADPRAAKALKKMASGKYSDAATDDLLHYAQTMAQANKRATAVKLYRKYFKSQESFLVRRTALLGLMQYGDKEGLKLSLSILKGKDETFKSVVIANVHYLSAEGAAARLIDQLGKLNAKQQAELMDMLVKLKGEQMLPQVKRMASNKSIDVRLSALRALGQIGDRSSVLILIGALDGTPAEKTLAKTSLLQLKARGTDDELIKQLPDQDEATRIALIQILTDRDSSGSVSELLKQATSGTSKLAVASYRAIRKLAEAKYLPELISHLQQCKNDKVRTAIVNALTGIAHRCNLQESLSGQIETALSTSQTIDTRKSLLKVAGKLYNERSLVILEKALQDKAVKGIALRQLAQWPDVEALPVLKSAYKNDSDRTNRIVALRAVIRLLKLQNQLTMADTVRDYRDVLAAAKQPEEKKMLLSGLAQLRTPQALDLVGPLLDEEGVRAEAQLAAVQIATAAAVDDPPASRALLTKVLAAPISDELKNNAQAAIDEIEEFENFTIDTPAKPLFDGKTFDGWNGNLGAFGIVDGAIVGGDLEKATPRSEYLCTTKTYGDFELRIKCKTIAADPEKHTTAIPTFAPDGGIQVRGRRTSGTSAMNGYEVDAGESTWGNIFDANHGRVSVGLKPEELEKIVRKGQWNSYVIICKGSRLQIWVNGKKTLDYKAATAQTGLIGLQLAGGYPGQLWYKDITIKVSAAEQAKAKLLDGVSEEVIAAARVRPLFDGKTLDGWEGNMNAFRVEDGAIVCGTMSAANPLNEYLCTEKEYTNFELRLKCKANRVDQSKVKEPLPVYSPNGGIQIRSERIPNNNNILGYQVDAGPTSWGNLYDERRHWHLVQMKAEEREKLVRKGQWNDYVILCNGLSVKVWLNGTKTVDYTEADLSYPQTGVFGLQIHEGPPGELWYKDITIKEF